MGKCPKTGICSQALDGRYEDTPGPDLFPQKITTPTKAEYSQSTLPVQWA